jgi:dCMP deaminase
MKKLRRESYFMQLAELTAKRGSCSRAQVGCVLVDEKTKRIISVGYNSSPKGTDECHDVGCLIHNDHCIRCLHAEQAAILNITTKPEKIICYVTHQPCLNCFKLLVGLGITQIYYLVDYPDPAREKYMEEALIKNSITMVKIYNLAD